MLRGVPPVFLAYWIPPSGPESQCIIQIGDFIKVDGDPRTFKVMDTVSTSQVGGPNQSMDFIVEIVTYQVPESDPNYATEYEILNKIF